MNGHRFIGSQKREKSFQSIDCSLEIRELMLKQIQYTSEADSYQVVEKLVIAEQNLR
jgi:hypothetical protein